MLTRLVFLTSLILAGLVFLTVAWPVPFASPAPDTAPLFVAQSVALDADLVALGGDGSRILRSAAERWAWQQAPWLKTKIRQTIRAEPAGVAEGFLQRGPNHCARLELSVHASLSSDRPAQLTVVSDGTVVAQARRTALGDPEIAVARLCEKSPAAPGDDAEANAKEETLDCHGCGGPGALLRRLHRNLHPVRMQTGLLAERPVIRIAGALDPRCNAVPPTRIPIDSCAIYLDAKTLWAQRVEWRNSERGAAAPPVLILEFLEPEIGAALSEDECRKMFSYRPN